MFTTCDDQLAFLLMVKFLLNLSINVNDSSVSIQREIWHNREKATSGLTFLYSPMDQFDPCLIKVEIYFDSTVANNVIVQKLFPLPLSYVLKHNTSSWPQPQLLYKGNILDLPKELRDYCAYWQLSALAGNAANN